jgi:hypothetical protein
MTLFCDGPVILPEHVVFAPDLEPEAADTARAGRVAVVPQNDDADGAVRDMSLGSAMQRHISFVYKQQSRTSDRPPSC